MRTYNSAAPTITIPLAEFQTLTQEARVLDRAIERGLVSEKQYDDMVEELRQEDLTA